MKKLLPLAVIGLLLSSGTYAQASFGAKLGLNLATQSWKGDGSEFFKTGMQPRIQIGAFGNYPITSNFSAQAELLYSGEGTTQKLKDNDEDFGGSGTLTFNYLRLPVLGQYSFAENFYAETGPSVGIVLSAKRKWNGDKQTIDEGYKTIDFGWNFGAGYDLSKVLTGLKAGIRYYHGLINMTERSNNGGNNFKNRVITLSAQYTLSK